MPTIPLSSTLQSALAGPTAWRFENELGPIFCPRWFCCTDSNAMSITDGKEPVAVITLSPNPAFTGETVSYSGTDSYDPDGSITGYDWDFESHTPGSGTASAGTLNYSTAGTYTIELIVQDGTSLKSSPARVELVVNQTEFQGYLATTGGVEYTDDVGAITWGNLDLGQSGNSLIVYDVKIDPATQHLPENKKTIWRCTRGQSIGPGDNGGVAVSNSGGASWKRRTPTITNTWGDSPAPVIGDVSFRQLIFVGSRLFVLATWQNNSSEWRSTIFYTDDAPKMRTDTGQTVTWTEL
jgi:hypothetical protein